MKFKFEKKYLLKGLTAFLVLAGAILLWYLVFHGEKFKGNIAGIKIMCIFVN